MAGSVYPWAHIGPIPRPSLLPQGKWSSRRRWTEGAHIPGKELEERGKKKMWRYLLSESRRRRYDYRLWEVIDGRARQSSLISSALESRINWRILVRMERRGREGALTVKRHDWLLVQDLRGSIQVSTISPIGNLLWQIRECVYHLSEAIPLEKKSLQQSLTFLIKLF